MKASAALREEADAGDCWKGFRPGDWRTSINVRDFIVRNVTPYTGDEDFLAGPSQRIKAVWAKLQPYFADERKKKGVLAVDAQSPSTMLAAQAQNCRREIPKPM
jgi:formate C-acetyltransferase